MLSLFWEYPELLTFKGLFIDCRNALISIVIQVFTKFPIVLQLEVSMESSSAKNGSVTVFIYEQELDFLKWLVLQKREIETGGDLFGLWQDERTAVVQLILGPGEKCRRTTTSFHQDVKYLRNVGGLCSTFDFL